MNTVSCVNISESGRLMVNTIIDDKKKKTSFVTIYDMKDIQVEKFKPKFLLSAKMSQKIVEALQSPKGQNILNKMKSERAEPIINTFLSYYKKGIKPASKMETLVDEIIKEPLTGEVSASFASIGITKKEIFEELIKEHLIKI